MILINSVFIFEEIVIFYHNRYLPLPSITGRNDIYSRADKAHGLKITTIFYYLLFNQ